MTSSVADKTPIPAKVWRRHTDPPGLWITVVIGSVALHLLAFWLIRSSNTFNLWFPQQNQAVVPIELIDIAPTTKSTTKAKLAAKRVSAKPLSSTPKSVPARTLQQSRTTAKSQDFSAVNSVDSLQSKSRTSASQPSTQPFGQRTVPTPKPTPTPTVTVGNIPWNRRQEIKLGKETRLPRAIPSNSPVSEAENKKTPPTPTRETPRTPTQETPPTPTRETPRTPTQETPPTPTRETPRTPTQETSPTPTTETSPTSTEEASVAIVASLPRNEVNNLRQAGELAQDALPDVIAVYTGSNTKQLDSSFLPHDFGLKPAQILASLVIDQNGNFKQAVVLKIEPATLQSEKTIYEQVLNEVFKTESFVAAHNNDGTKPELSNLFVQIKIQSVNSN